MRAALQEGRLRAADRSGRVHPTVLTYWRRRLARSTRPNRIFDAVRGVVAATGALAGKTRRALDSPGLEDAVATQGTGDRKRTRLNSSHANISYSVFCLKKKKPS